MTHIHFVSAHFGGRPPWRHQVNHSGYKVTCAYYDDCNTASRHLAMHPRLKGKIPKMMEWQFIEADWYVWLDSSIQILSDDVCDWILQSAADKPLCLFKHSYASTIREEAQRVMDNLKRGSPYIRRRYQGEPILQQLVHYYGDPEFVDNKLFGLTFFAYHKSAVGLMREWFEHNVVWSIQDQLSFPYVLQKSGLDYSLFEGLITDTNPYFEWNWKSREQHLTPRSSDGPYGAK